MCRLRVKDTKERQALAAMLAPAGPLVKDKFTQQPGALEHAIAMRATMEENDTMTSNVPSMHTQKQITLAYQM